MTAAELAAKLERERLMGMPRWDITGDTERKWRLQLRAAAVDEMLKTGGKRDRPTTRL